MFLFPTSLKISAQSEETPKKEFEAIFFAAAADFYSILFKTAQTSFLIVFLRRVDDLPGLQQRPLVPLDVERQAEQHGENHAALKKKEIRLQVLNFEPNYLLIFNSLFNSFRDAPGNKPRVPFSFIY